MSGEDQPLIYERGDVVYGADPFKSNARSRPWLILSNHEGRPFHGEQYIAVTMTTKEWHDGLIAVPEEYWVEGGTPAESRIVPWGVQSISATDVDFWQGHIEDELVGEVVDALVGELEE